MCGSLTLRSLVKCFVPLFWMFISFSSYAKSGQYCMADWACVEKIEKNKQVSYWLYNKKPFVLTVTLEIDTSNLKTSSSNQRKHIVNQVLQGHQRVKVVNNLFSN